ncbi:hypothetical protein BU23DRAFT_281265 [Bimuria novae-zelandiae CBS 107.79]|uniref:Uncharacterized protein n=1 Tax=Bimuria novae-zelandiae CBS 107.79 TaxID=1447943 RepID=A0A6A5V3D6_9PLEO|nr:hypothetical protein BU23DRAFT_281265 [Bimuria novae-zelandiae CBS 107.79]
MELANKVAGGAAALLLCRELETGPSSGHHEETLAKMGKRVVSRAGAPRSRSWQQGCRNPPLGREPGRECHGDGDGVSVRGKGERVVF